MEICSAAKESAAVTSLSSKRYNEVSCGSLVVARDPILALSEHLIKYTVIEPRLMKMFAFRKESRHRDRNLVDPASSHMLVSKIKPCMSQYKSQHGETANGSLKQF